jgi:reductive dehalogenase
MLSKPRYKIVGEMERYDERLAMQGRGFLQAGTEAYAQFYELYPNLKDRDDQTRAIEEFEGAPLDHPFFKQIVMNTMRNGAEQLIDGPPAPVKADISPERATEKAKGFARFLGGDLVRVGPLNPAFVYSHIGKGVQEPVRKYGAPITLNHKHAIVIAIGLDPALVKTGPVLPMVSHVMLTYNRLATISIMLAGYIRSLGYHARAHMVANYEVICPPVAIDAGMGELGRHGIMLTKEFGSAVKLTVVTTDLPLVYDPPVDIGVDEFCKDCKICAESCPSAAIPFGDKKVVRGVEKWAINSEACYRVWRETGTDCGVCVASCPWTKQRTPLHRLAVSIATKKKKAGWWMSRADKMIYGKFKPSASPSFFEEPPPVWKKYKSLQ